MSVHAWVKKKLAAYVAGGLSAASRRRLERHAAECAECERALDEARSVDHELTALFADVRPGPALEEEAIRRLRQAPLPARRTRLSRKVRVALAVAATVLLAVSGAGLSALIEDDGVRFPGEVASRSPFRLGADLSGGTILVYDLSLKRSVDAEGKSYWGILKTNNSGDLSDPDKLAAAIRGEVAGRYSELTHGTTNHGMNFRETNGAMADGSASMETPFPSLASRPPGHGTGSMAGQSKRRDWLMSGGIDGVVRKEAFSPDGKTPAKGLPGTDWGEANGSVRGLGGKQGGEGKPFSSHASSTLASGYSPSRQLVPISPPKEFKPGEAFAQLGPKTVSDEGRKGGGQSTGPAREPARMPEAQPPRGEGGTKTDPPGKKQPPAVGADNKAAGTKKPDDPAQGRQPVSRKIIRSGEVDFEVDSFYAAVDTIYRLVNPIKGAYVATVNSEKLANGKMRGSVVVRVPPDRLDDLVLGLRKELGKTGELKGQRIGSQDITKQYTDLESRLRAARTMEERLLKIIREGKGQIKDLVAAEKELGVWRTQVEEIEGELRYYANLVALSTLTIKLAEKEIRTAASVTERERVQAGVEVEDVEAAMRALLEAVDEARGRVTRSELKQHGAGQFNAQLHFEVAPDKAGPVRDRLRQLGTVARLEIDRVQQAEGGTLPHNGKLKRGDTQFLVSLYNLATVTPRETVTLRLAAPDVAAAYRALRAAVGKAQGRLTNAQLNEQDRQNVTGQLDFAIRRADESGVQKALAEVGELLSRSVVRAAEGENVTDAKVAFKVELVPAAAIPPRETVVLAVEVADVKAALAVLSAQVKEAGGTVHAKAEAQETSGRVTARVVYRVPLAAAAGVEAKVESAGHVRVRRLAPDPKAPEGKLAVAEIDVTLSNGELLVPSEQGLWAQVRGGLAVSLRGLSLSASWLIVGLLFVLPWVLLIYALIWLVRRLWRGDAGSAPAAPPSASSGTTAAGA